MGRESIAGEEPFFELRLLLNDLKKGDDVFRVAARLSSDVFGR